MKDTLYQNVNQRFADSLVQIELAVCNYLFAYTVLLEGIKEKKISENEPATRSIRKLNYDLTNLIESLTRIQQLMLKKTKLHRMIKSTSYNQGLKTDPSIDKECEKKIGSCIVKIAKLKSEPPFTNKHKQEIDQYLPLLKKYYRQKRSILHEEIGLE